MPDGDATIDALPRADALGLMLSSHVAAAQTVLEVTDQIDAAAELMAHTFMSGHTVVYAAAGSSGLMALADASELSGTFGIPQHQVRIAMAGGVPTEAIMPGETEDQTDAAVESADHMEQGDIAIVISASGTTPFACAFADRAKERGNRIVGIANIPDAPLLRLADIAIALPTVPEVLDGSTRLGAGTAQKIALNMMSTQAGILLGHVHDGLMVNLKPENAKLRARAQTIVAKIARVSDVAAKEALSDAGKNTKLAILIASGVEKTTAQSLLNENDHRLRDCLNRLPVPAEET